MPRSKKGESAPAPEMTEVRIGCAGWSIPRAEAGAFPTEGSHLVRYAQVYRAVEINSSFYRPHRPATYTRWASETPSDFRFSVKVPREVTHRARLVGAGDVMTRFLAETAALGSKRGPLLVQLPPSLKFDPAVADAFFSALRCGESGPVACEPRHPTWFTPEAEHLLRTWEIARVAADPAVVPEAARPGGWCGLTYYRLHGSPKMYSSAYTPEALDALARQVAEAAATAPAWCIFDNTAQGAATGDSLALMRALGSAV